MGVAKPLLLWRGEPLVRHVARVLSEGGVASVIVVVGPDAIGAAINQAVAGLLNVVVTTNVSPERGMLSSIQVGVTELLAANPEAPAFLVCPCDLPKLEPEHIFSVLNKAVHCDASAIVAPVYGGKRGHPTAFGITLVSEILQLDSTQFGLNEIVKRHDAHVVEIPAESDAVLRDADTPEEWRQLTTE